jgi:hypothetical protein
MTTLLKVSNVRIERKTAPDSKEMESILSLMVKNGISDPRSMLPSSPWYNISFDLKNTYSGFANAIRRTLIEEMPVKCISFNEDDMSTNDEFILSDILLKNINLLPINQDIDSNKYLTKTISLYKHNDTNKIIDVKASDIQVTTKNTDPEKSQQSSNKLNKKAKEKSHKYDNAEENDKLIPDANIIIIRLRPNKFVKIPNIIIEEGLSKNNAAKFSLFDNVSYNILDMVPYDIFKHTGTRSISYDPKEFHISFTTCANISPQLVIELLYKTINDKLTKAKNYISEYSITDQTKKYYYTEGFEVSVMDNIFTYKFHGEYIMLSNIIAQRCYLLDPTILFCAPAIDRYDNEIAIIRLKHPDTNKLLLSAIDACKQDMNILSDVLTNTKKI